MVHLAASIVAFWVGVKAVATFMIAYNRSIVSKKSSRDRLDKLEKSFQALESPKV